MTTFKNNAKYGELMFLYLDVAWREQYPLSVPEVLRAFNWRFKGGSLAEASTATELRPGTSLDAYPEGWTRDIASEWPDGKQAVALARILIRRAKSGLVKSRGLLARLGTYQLLVSDYGQRMMPRRVYIGMHSIYHMFWQVWDWAQDGEKATTWDTFEVYTRELLIGACAPSMVDIPTVEDNRRDYSAMLNTTRVPALMRATQQVKDLIKAMGSGTARAEAKRLGALTQNDWETRVGMGRTARICDLRAEIRFLTLPLGPMKMKVGQGLVVLGNGETRYALGRSDVERLHQLIMSATSALVGVCVQACVGTPLQKSRAKRAVVVADSNISRIVRSSKLVPVGDEVLVCKAYRRAYTAHLGWLAGPLCSEEYRDLVAEAESTAPPGVIDVQGFLQDLRTLDAASSLNAAKVFKICPAPDVSPATAMMDRIKQIGNGNVVDPDIMPEFETELRTQILRGYIRAYHGRLKLRMPNSRPMWFGDYLAGDMDKVPSSDIHTFLAWEGTGTMPDVSKYDPVNWKDSGLGADTIWQATNCPDLGHKRNMLTRLIFDEDCPMPGRMELSEDHVIKLFVKAEGHKDPARAIFSANLTDRQAQSWMERAVEQVATSHPSYMIGQEVDVREARTVELTKKPSGIDMLALYYSFDISGWSAKMPAEPQRISHKIWADIYGGHLFSRATEINEGAHIYMALDGYWGWYKNTHSNLEGFNGKEMTMILIALLSLSVKRWRVKVAEQGVLTEVEAKNVSALLFAYIDDGLCRIDLPRAKAMAAFSVYKRTVIETFARCGFSIEISKCFPSDRFAIFLNEVYIAGRHVVHGVRAAMGISSEPTERHTSLIERVSSVSTGCRGAVMAGLNPMSAVLLMAYHVFLHLLEWTSERDPVILAVWSLAARAWGGLGLPNTMQLFVSGSGAAFEESVATMQDYARVNPTAEAFFYRMCKTELQERTPMGVLTAPLSGRVEEGVIADNRVAIAVRKALAEKQDEGRLSSYADRLLRYSDSREFERYADSIVPLQPGEVLQEQMLVNLAEAHPHSIFSMFARRLEKATTVKNVVGYELFWRIISENRTEAERSSEIVRARLAS